MDTGLTFAKVHSLRPGIALSAAQMAQLTADIVWLVEQSVLLADGSQQKVLVPQVYVRVQPGDLNGSGTLLAGRQIDIKLTGTRRSAYPRQIHAAMRPVVPKPLPPSLPATAASRRCEKNLDGLLAVHQPGLLSLP